MDGEQHGIIGGIVSSSVIVITLLAVTDLMLLAPAFGVMWLSLKKIVQHRPASP